MKKVERVALSEIAAERGEQVRNAVPNSVLGEKKNRALNLSYYISQLKDSEIKKFFAPLGYVEHMFVDNDSQKMAGPYYIVICNNYIIFFNDYSTKVNIIEETNENDLFNNLTKLNPDQLLEKYAEITNTPAGKLIADSITVNFLGRRFSETYPKKKKAFDENNIKMAFNELDPEQKRFFAAAKEIQEADITSRYNMNAYGMANIEKQIRNS